MGWYYLFWYNTYAFSLLFYMVYMKRENAGSWNSGLEKEQILETYSAQVQSPETPRKSVLEYIKNIGRRKHQRGASHRPCGWRARPYLLGHLAGPRCPSSGLRCLLPWKKIRRKLSRRSTAVSRRNLGRSNLGLWRSYSAGETSLQEGENRSHRHHQ